MPVNVFFDLDMTLAYRITMWTQTVRELLLEECVVVKEEDIKPFNIGNGYPWNRPELSHEEFFHGKDFWTHIKDYMIEGLIERNITTLEVAKRVADAFPKRFLEPSYWRVFRDSIPTICKLKDRGYKVHIISNNIPECREILDNLHLTSLFDSLTLSYEVGYEKPNKKIFEAALKGHENEINIMVGDNYNADVLGALNVGMPAILVRRGNPHNYKYYCSDFSQLEQTIDEVLKVEIR